MTLKLLSICTVLAGFAFGFSELVSHAHENAPPAPLNMACQDWSGQGCNPLLEQ